jgi:hypothetical protein
MRRREERRWFAALAALSLLAAGFASADPASTSANREPGIETRSDAVQHPVPGFLPGCWRSRGGHGVRFEGGAVIYEASARHPFAVGHGRWGCSGSWGAFLPTVVIGGHGHGHRRGGKVPRDLVFEVPARDGSLLRRGAPPGVTFRDAQ